MKELIISSIISGIIGFCIPYVMKCIGYVIKRGKNTHICGEWYSYYWAYKEDNLEFRYDMLYIKKGMLNEYSINVNEEGLEYGGYGRIENNQLCLKFYSRNAILRETIYHRYDLATYKRQRTLYGLWLGVDHDIKVSSGGAILTREKLSQEEYNRIVQKIYLIKSQEPIIRIVE